MFCLAKQAEPPPAERAVKQLSARGSHARSQCRIGAAGKADWPLPVFFSPTFARIKLPAFLKVFDLVFLLNPCQKKILIANAQFE